MPAFYTTDDIKLFERALIAIHPVISRVARFFPSMRPESDESSPFPSAMLAEHNWLYKLIFPCFFRKVSVDANQLDTLREAAKESQIVYIAKRMGQLEYQFFNHLFLKEEMPLACYTNALTLRRWMRFRDLWRSISKQELEIAALGHPADPIEDGLIADMVASSKSPLILIPQSNLTDDGLLFTGPNRALSAIVAACRVSDRCIKIVPLDFVWGTRPEHAERSIYEILFGEREESGRIRRSVQFWRNYVKKGRAMIGQPIDVFLFLKGHMGDDNHLIASRLREALMKALLAQRRQITGPAIRPLNFFIHEVTSDEKLDEQICRIAIERNKPADDLRELAARYAKEIAANVDYTYIEVLERILRRVFGGLYDALDIDIEGLKKAKDIYSRGPVVFVPNHKSHMDYLILSYILHTNGMTIPHIAAGINLEFWPLGKIFRHCGAFFIRRAFRDNPLYKAVLETYLKVLLKEGYCQEFFIEGGRSRAGKLAKPRKGMLKMLHRAAREAGVKNLNFIPVSITYDRVIEDKSYVNELEGEQKVNERPGHLLRLTKYLKRQKHRYGSIYVRFGEPILATEDGDNDLAMEGVAYKICHQINRNLVVTPAAIAAAALLAGARRGVPLSDVKRNWATILAYLSAKGTDISVKIKKSPDTVMDEALSLFVNLKLVQSRLDAVEPYYAVDEDKRMSLAFFKNGIVHFIAAIGLASHIIIKLSSRGQAPEERTIAGDFEAGRQLLFHEFRMATRLPVREHISKTIDFLANCGAVIRIDGALETNRDRLWILKLFAEEIRPFFETFRIAIRHVTERLTTEQDERALLAGMIETGHDLFLLGQVRYREAISKVGFESILKPLVALKCLSIAPEKTGTKRRKIYAPAGDFTGIQNLKAQLEGLL